jgi:hypothetical protein
LLGLLLLVEEQAVQRNKDQGTLGPNSITRLKPLPNLSYQMFHYSGKSLANHENVNHDLPDQKS